MMISHLVIAQALDLYIKAKNNYFIPFLPSSSLYVNFVVKSLTMKNTGPKEKEDKKYQLCQCKRIGIIRSKAA